MILQMKQKTGFSKVGPCILNVTLVYFKKHTFVIPLSKVKLVQVINFLFDDHTEGKIKRQWLSKFFFQDKFWDVQTCHE